MGSVVHPAGAAGTPGVTRTTGSVVNPGGGGIHLVVPGQQNRTNSGARGFNRGGYAYPVYIGGYYDMPYISSQDYVQQSSPQQAQPNVTVVMPPPSQPTPVVINNYYPGSGVSAPDGGRVQNVPQTEDSEPAAEPTHYLIAFTDHTIYAATAYWVDGDTLHYFTAGNTHNQVSLALVDRAFTERLNKEAGVDVKLPSAAK